MKSSPFDEMDRMFEQMDRAFDDMRMRWNRDHGPANATGIDGTTMAETAYHTA